eukprot:jgi/Tetstr1/462825/TSEL_007775.t1
MALLEVREVWNARRSADSVRLELLDPDAARLLHDVCRDAVLALPFGDQTQGRAVVQVTVEHSEECEDAPTTPHQGAMPPSLSKQFFRCALAAKAICTGPLANLDLPTVEQLAEAIEAIISQRINTPPAELQHAQWLTDTMMAAGVEMQQHHTEPTLLRVGDDNLCAISLGKEDEEFADTLHLAVALTSLVALLYTLTLQLTAHHHSTIGGTRGTDRTEQWRKTVPTACGEIKAAPTEPSTSAEQQRNTPPEQPIRPLHLQPQPQRQPPQPECMRMTRQCFKDYDEENDSTIDMWTPPSAGQRRHQIWLTLPSTLPNAQPCNAHSEKAHQKAKHNDWSSS